MWCSGYAMHGRREGKRLRAPLKWKKNALTYSIDSYSQDLSNSIQKKTVQEAFQFWAAVSPLTFREVAREGDIRVGLASF
ncbi:unnamed protein product, partial [Mesorhabditis spiculigera]